MAATVLNGHIVLTKPEAGVISTPGGVSMPSNSRTPVSGGYDSNTPHLNAVVGSRGAKTPGASRNWSPLTFFDRLCNIFVATVNP
jgi:hypothetical protein